MMKTAKKTHTMDVILVIILSFITVFTVAMTVCFIQYRCVPDTLIASVYGLATGELGAMSWIKNSKEKKLRMEMQSELAKIEIERLQQIAELKEKYGDNLPSEVLQAMQFVSIN